MSKNNGFVEGYGKPRFIKGIGPDEIPTTPVPPSQTGGFTEGYVDGGERDIKPFNPNQQVIEEIIIVPPAGGNGGILFVQYVTSVNATFSDGDFITSDSFAFVPVTKSDMWITVNGLPIYPANGVTEVSTSAFYVTDSTGSIIRPKGTYQVGDMFKWNGSIANYQIETDDEIKIVYEV